MATDDGGPAFPRVALGGAVELRAMADAMIAARKKG
jgi:hypothetical protein